VSTLESSGEIFSKKLDTVEFVFFLKVEFYHCAAQKKTVETDKMQMQESQSLFSAPIIEKSC
jgi:hypothetical protein